MEERILEYFFFSEEDLEHFSYETYKFGGLRFFLLFLRLCRIATRANGLEFLKKHEEWAIALGFYKGIPHESDVTKFIAKIGADLDVYFVLLLRFIRENISIRGVTSFHISGFMQRANRFGVAIRTGTGKSFTRYNRGTEWASPCIVWESST